MRYFTVEPLENRIAPATLSIAPQSFSEGDDANKTVNIVITLDAPAVAGTKVDYAVVAGTATSADFDAVTGTATFELNATTATIPVVIHGNTTPEADRAFAVNLSNAVNATLGASSSGAITILDDEHFVSFKAESVTQSIAEGDSGLKSVTYYVQLDAAATHPITVQYASADGSAASSGPLKDFNAISGSLTFNPGDTIKSFTLAVLGDTLPGADESFTVNLTLPGNTGAKLGTATATTTITNDDPGTITTPVISIGDTSVTEGGNAVFTVSLSSAGESDVSVHYQTVAGTATAGDDFVAQADTVLTFHGGVTSQTVSVPVKLDKVSDAGEAFQLQLSSPTGATLATKTAGTATIAEPSYTLKLTPAQVTEGNEGNSSAIFFATINELLPAGATLTFQYKTTDGNALDATEPPALEGSDYVKKTGTVVFSPGAQTQAIIVDVIGDRVLEKDESFTLTLSDPLLKIGTQEGSIVQNGSTQAIGKILNDESKQVTVSVTAKDAVLPEGDAGATTPVHFDVSLSGALDHGITIPLTINGQSFSVPIPANTLTAGLNFTLQGDNVFTGDQTVTATLGTLPAGNPETLVASNTAKTATTAIWEDDVKLVLTGGAVFEGNTGTKSLPFVVSLQKPDGSPAVLQHEVSMHFVTEDGTGPNGATSTGTFADYDKTLLTVTLAPGQTSETLNVPIRGDTLPGGDEIFTGRLQDVVGVYSRQALPSVLQAAGVIQNDDGAPPVPVITVANGNGAEGGNVTFNAALNTAIDGPVSFQYATALGGSTPASAEDFTAPAAGATITFAGGQTSATVNIAAVDDTFNEGAETFLLSLTNAVGATLASQSATGTIAASDQPTLTIATQTVLEGNSGTKMLEFTAQLSAATDRDVTFTVKTVDDTAKAGSDYTALSKQVTIFKGDTSAKFSVEIIGDTDASEVNETFLLSVDPLSGATLATGAIAGNILNDDSHFSIAPVKPSVAESAGSASFTITRDTSKGVASVQYQTVDGTATSLGATPDFTARTGVASFADGETSVTITVPVLEDISYEAGETFGVALFGTPANGVLGTPTSATVTINDNDILPTVSLANAPIVVEGDSGVTNMVFTLTLDHANQANDVVLHYSTIGGTAVGVATPGQDYQEVLGGTVTFAKGETSKQILVKVLNDTTRDSFLYEALGIEVTLDNTATAKLAGNVAKLSATSYIQDNDSLPVASVANTTIHEGSETDGFTISLSRPSDLPVTVSYYTRALNATAGADFTNIAPTTVTFAPGETSKLVQVKTTADNLTEGDEYLTLNLYAATNANLTQAGSLAYGLLADGDSAAVVVNDVQIVEGDSGTKQAVFTITVQGKTAKPITLNYATADGTALAGQDYTPVSGFLAIASDKSDTSTASISVPITGDLGAEANETFTLNLSNLSLGTLVRGTGTGTILNDSDTLPVLTVDNPTIVESGVDRTLEFTVKLSEKSTTPVTFQASTEGIVVLNNAATAGSDYTAISNQLVTIQPGDKEAKVSVTIKGDTAFEFTEFFNLRLSNLQGAAAGKLVGTATVYDDDLYVSGQTAAWTDTDGDLVVLTVNKGTLSEGLFSFLANGASPTYGGRVLSQLNLFSAGQAFAKANLTIASYQQPDATGKLAGDGLVNVGYIRANNFTNSVPLETTGIDLGTVLIDGDLSRIDAGDLFNDAGISFLGVKSLGVKSAATETGYDSSRIYVSNLLAGASWIYSTGDVQGTVYALGQSSGSIGRLNIEGALKGGANDQSGFIGVSGTLGFTVIKDIIGGGGDQSGSLRRLADTAAFGPITIQGNFTGGTGTDSGSIVAPAIYSVSVAQSMHGGIIAADNALGFVTIGKDLDNHAFVIGGGLTNNIAIYGVTVKGNVNDAFILGGYTSSRDPLNADAQINAIQIDGSVKSLDILAGATTLGTAFQSAVVDSSSVRSKIASIIFNGPILPNNTGVPHFIAAQQIDQLVLNGVARVVTSTAQEIESGTGFYAVLV